MRLKTLSIVGSSISIILIMLLVYSLAVVSNHHTEMIKQEIMSHSFSRGVLDLGILTGDFLLYQNERSGIQWLNRYKSLKPIILQQKEYMSDKDINTLLSNYSKSLKLFQQISKIQNQGRGLTSKTRYQFQKRALSDQLQNTIQSMSSTAHQLSKLFHERLHEVVREIQYLISVLLLVIIMSVSFVWYMFVRRVTRPINSLMKKVKVFSADLTQRVSSKHDDEIGELANAFNTMAEQLSDTMVSRDKMNHQAHHDALTGLPNRILFMDRLNQVINNAARNGSRVAVIFIDLDRFKSINDSLGHKVGDEVLICLSERLQKCMRKTDTVSRMGGDEFIVIMDSITAIDDIADIVEKVMTELLTPIPIKEHKLYITLSLGISIYPDDANNAESLIRNADVAMYKAKEDGRNTYRYYTEEMTRKAFEHIMIESNLRRALEKNDLTLYYQPQVNTKTMDIVGIEALVRWEHSELGLIRPDKFISLAEDTGLIFPLGEQVLDMACKQIVQWHALYDKKLRIAVNFSVKQLQQSDIVDKILQTLKKNRCQPEWIELEVTEGYIMTDPQQAIETLQKIRAMGIIISIDDFGTGYSSLNYLKKLPINKLKIDQSFVRDVTSDEDDRSIIVAIISLANSMNLNVIAEGVETEEQKDILKELGCEYVQGFLYSKPVDSEKITHFLQNGLEYTSS